MGSSPDSSTGFRHKYLRLSRRRSQSINDLVPYLSQPGSPKSQLHRDKSSRLSPHNSSIHLSDSKSLKHIFVPQHEPSCSFSDISESLPLIRPLERKPTREADTAGVPFTHINTPSVYSSMALPHPEILDTSSTETREGFMSSIISAAHHLTSSIVPREKPLVRGTDVSTSTILEENQSITKATMVQYVQSQSIKESSINTSSNDDPSLATFSEATKRDDTNPKVILTPATSEESTPGFVVALSPQVSKNRHKPKIFATFKTRRRSLSLNRTVLSADRSVRELSSSVPETPLEPTLDVEFHQLFKTLPMTEKCTAVYGCALSKEILVHGKLYVSTHHLCFNSNSPGWVTNLVIPLKKVVQIEKKSTAVMLPNAMVVQTLHERYVFASFLSRDSSSDMLTETWRNAVQESAVRGDPRRSRARRRSGTLSSTFCSPTDLSSEELDYHYSSNTEELSIASDEPKASELSSGAETGHAPTFLGYIKAPSDVEIVNETLNAPLGTVFGYLFGNDVSNLRNILEKQNNRDISQIPVFKKDPSGKKTRKYNYVKPLHGPIGPKQTKCEVTEIIEKEDFDSSIMVLRSARTPDMPSGGSFSVQTRFYFAWGENNGTKVYIVASVEWTSKSWIKNAVENGSISGQKELLGILISELKAFVAANGKGRTRSKSKRKKSEVIEAEVTPVVPPSPSPPGLITTTDSLSTAIPLPIPYIIKIPALLLIVYLIFSFFGRTSNGLLLGSAGMYQMEHNGRIYNLVPSVHDSRNEKYFEAGGELWDWMHDRAGTRKRGEERSG